MEHLHNYNNNFYYDLEGHEEGSGPTLNRREQPKQVAASMKSSKLVDSENKQGNLNHRGHMSPYNTLDPEGDHSNQAPMEADPKEPAILLAEVPRRQPNRHQIQFHFTQWHVQEMETIFQETQYPDVLTRQVLGRNMNVPEVKVQTWFNNRRDKQLVSEKKAMFRSAPPGIQDHISMMDVEEP